MAKSKKNKHSRYRLVVLDDDTHEQLYSSKWTRGGITVIIATVILIPAAITFAIIAFSPLRVLIPGYPSSSVRAEAVRNIERLDSLENALAKWDLQLTNIQRVLTGREPLDIDSILIMKNQEGATSTISKEDYMREDSLLRKEIMDQERYSISKSGSVRVKQIEGMLFYPPVKGMVTESYNPGIRHPYVDIAVTTNSMVNAVLDGTVISAEWSDDTGYVIRIQHDNDLISVYKHCVKALKNTGDKVKAGTGIAVAGNAGKLSTGPHLHFELWYKGEAVDPTKYIKF